VKVDADNYLSDVSILINDEDAPQSQSSPTVLLPTGETNRVYDWIQDWNSDDYNSALPIPILVTFSVKTGAAFEASQYFYANYRVVLKVELQDQDGKTLDGSDVNDYIIYTNARIYTGIVDGGT
jgi:hypothetical protein